MQFQQANGALAAMWIMGAGLIGLLANVTSITGAAMVFGFGLVPPVLLMVRWTDRVRAVPLHAKRTQRPDIRPFDPTWPRRGKSGADA